MWFAICRGGPWDGEAFAHSERQIEMTGLSRGWYVLKGWPQIWQWEEDGRIT